MGNFARFALSVGAAALLAGCGGSQSPIGASGAMPQAPAFGARTDSASYKVVYSFRGVPDGSAPMASLIDVDGTLYGTTEAGGVYGSSGSACQLRPGGCGTALHSFGRGSDGSSPSPA